MENNGIVIYESYKNDISSFDDAKLDQHIKELSSQIKTHINKISIMKFLGFGLKVNTDEFARINNITKIPKKCHVKTELLKQNAVWFITREKEISFDDFLESTPYIKLCSRYLISIKTNSFFDISLFNLKSINNDIKIAKKIFKKHNKDKRLYTQFNQLNKLINSEIHLQLKKSKLRFAKNEQSQRKNDVLTRIAANHDATKRKFRSTINTKTVTQRNIIRDKTEIED